MSRKWAALLIVAGCASAPAVVDSPPVIYDGGPYSSDDDPEAGGTREGRACTNLRKLGCKAGFRRPGEETCTATLAHIVDSGITRVDLLCLARAKTPDQVREECKQPCTVVDAGQ